MILPRPARRPPDEHVIPLINVVFLLLIFFMLVGRIEPPAPVAVEPPASARARAVAPAGPVVAVAADGRAWLDGAPIEPAALAERAAGARGVLVRADGRAPAGRVIAVLRALEAAGARDVRLLARPAEGAP
jgi:biopolymer transport protein ExbD